MICLVPFLRSRLFLPSVLLFLLLSSSARATHKITHRIDSEMCWDKFDMNYRNQCMGGKWEERYYFDHATLTCRQFWYDGCRSNSRNMFDDALTCQWLCEAQPMYKSKSCLEDFDQRYKGMCNGGRWRHQYYFDRHTKKCNQFWYDGCKGSTSNLYPDELTCLKTCEDPAAKDRPPTRPPPASHPRHTTHHHHRRTTKTISRITVNTAEPTARTISAMQPWHTNDKHRMKELLGDVFRPNTTSVCETANPCRNNATCHFEFKKNTYYCKCKGGWKGSHCTEVVEIQVCDPNPCKNGAICKAKYEKEKSSFECYCNDGWGGPTCSERPCVSNPCENGGSCRATVASSTYFCDCAPNFGGKNCEYGVGEEGAQKDKYGTNVAKFSSGNDDLMKNLAEFARKHPNLAKKDETSKEKMNDDPDVIEKKKQEEKVKREQEEESKRIQNNEMARQKSEADALAAELAKQNWTEKPSSLSPLPSILSHLIPFILACILSLF